MAPSTSPSKKSVMATHMHTTTPWGHTTQSARTHSSSTPSMVYCCLICRYPTIALFVSLCFRQGFTEVPLCNLCLHRFGFVFIALMLLALGWCTTSINNSFSKARLTVLYIILDMHFKPLVLWRPVDCCRFGMR